MTGTNAPWQPSAKAVRIAKAIEDNVGLYMAGHVHALSREILRLSALQSETVAELKAEKDEAYRQRNVLVAALARMYPSGIRRTNIEGWSDDWHGCVYIDLPSGQISYHYHDSQAHLFSGLPTYTKPWDGHGKKEVEDRLLTITACAPSPNWNELFWNVRNAMAGRALGWEKQEGIHNGTTIAEELRHWIDELDAALLSPRERQQPDKEGP